MQHHLNHVKMFLLIDFLIDLSIQDESLRDLQILIKLRWCDIAQRTLMQEPLHKN